MEIGGLMNRELEEIVNYVKKYYPAITMVDEKGLFAKKYIYFYRSNSIYSGGSPYNLRMLASSSKRHILEKVPMMIETVFIDDDYPMFQEVQAFLFSYAEEYSIGGIARSKIAAGEYESIDAYKATFGAEFVKEVSDLSIWYWGILNHRIPLITLTEEDRQVFDEKFLWLVGNGIFSTHIETLTRSFTAQQEKMGELIDGGLIARLPKTGLNLINTPFDLIYELNESWQRGLSELNIHGFSSEMKMAISDISSCAFNTCQRIYDGRTW